MPDWILGAREITDPQTEIERLAAARARPPEPGSRSWLGDVHYVVNPREVVATHLPTGIQGRGPRKNDALQELAVILVARGDITVSDARPGANLEFPGE